MWTLRFQLCLWRGVFHLIPICLVTLHLGRKAQGRGSMYWYLPLPELCSDVLQLHEYCNEAHSLHYSSAPCWFEDADVRAQALPATGCSFSSLCSVTSDRRTPPPPIPFSWPHVGAPHVISYVHTKETVQRWWIIEGAKSSLRCSAPGLKLDSVRAAIRNKIICIYVDANIAVFLQTRASVVRFSLYLRVISLIECWCVPEEWRTDRRWKKKCREGTICAVTGYKYLAKLQLSVTDINKMESDISCMISCKCKLCWLPHEMIMEPQMFLNFQFS